ncbi:MAG: hypothetical protein HYZ81_08895, partial [Nitrospinae bacterium]|nr:hypothetical protein [Nitrospinota bacterium]
FSLLIDRIAGSALLAYRWRKRASAVGTALLILLVVGAMGPHVVHHLFDADHGQTCLLSTQASHFPPLAAAGPSVVLAQAIERWKPSLPASRPQVHLAINGLPRAPPSAHA